jgi:hypothetical protein
MSRVWKRVRSWRYLFGIPRTLRYGAISIGINSTAPALISLTSSNARRHQTVIISIIDGLLALRLINGLMEHRSKVGFYVERISFQQVLSTFEIDPALQNARTPNVACSLHRRKSSDSLCNRRILLPAKDSLDPLEMPESQGGRVSNRAKSHLSLSTFLM